MKQQSAISSRLSATTANASRKPATTCVRYVCSLLAISIVLTLSTAADNSSSSDARYNDLGHRINCICNSEPVAMGQRCHQALLECNHLNCSTSDHMRRELRAALQKGDKDDVILHWFVQKYGATVLVATADAKLVWMVAFAALAAIASFVIPFVRKRQSRPAK